MIALIKQYSVENEIVFAYENHVEYLKTNNLVVESYHTFINICYDYLDKTL